MSSAAAYPHLLAPGRIGTMELRNRILMCPMGHHLSNPDGTVSDNEAAYFEARARGGAALLIVGNVGVASPSGTSDGRMTAASDDRHLPGLAGLADRVHRHGGRIAAQLNHQGKMSLLDVAEGRPMLVPYPPPAGPADPLMAMVTPGETAGMLAAMSKPGAKYELRIADEDDIATVIARYAEAAERCVRAGFDGVELHAGHGYLIDEFLSPHNTRDDGWGGDVAGRARLMVEVIGAVRARVGADFPVWIRVNAEEPHKPDGERLAEQLQFVDLAVAAGIDAVHVTSYADDATGPTDSYAPHVVGPLRDHAAAVRARVNLPVITMGRYEADEAEALLAAGTADFVAMGRKLLADPDLPAKLAEGRSASIRPCIYQYRCIGNIYVSEPLRCVANARTGREHDVEVTPTDSPQRVLVIGGGPAGLGAARLLAARGHRVELWERGDALGGLLLSAAGVDPIMARYLEWLQHEIAESDVDVALARAATIDEVRDAAPHHVIVASGARWERPAVPGADRAHVHSVDDLAGWFRDPGSLDLGPAVLVVGGSKIGASVAAQCRRLGTEVTLTETTSVFLPELGLPGRFRIVDDLDRSGVHLRPDTVFAEVGDGWARLVGPDGEERVQADTVILATGAAPDTRLADELRASGIPAHLVGNCRAVRNVEGAELDATDVALALP